MNTVKKILVTILALSLMISLASCGSNGGTGSGDNSSSQESSTPADNSSSEEKSETNENSGEIVKLTIGASPAPHMEILENVKETLLDQGVELEIVEYLDYVMPNTALNEGELDANYFQHEPYMNDFNSENGGDLVAAGYIHYEPLGLYPGKSLDIKNVPDGAAIGIPDDATNGGRALLLLEVQGIIKLKEGIEFSKLTKHDIVENPHNVEIVEFEAAQVPIQLPDLDFAVINGNYALSSGIVDTVIVTEDENSVAIDYVNVIAVKSGNEKNEAIVKLVEALKNESSKEFIQNKYGKSVIVYEEK